MVPWILEEMQGVDLGDARLERRATKVLTAMSAAPGASLPQACGRHADLTGAYRLFDNEAVSLAQMLAGHRAATLRRAAVQPVVLAVQDSTWLDYGTHRGCTGLGAHSHRQQLGLLAHVSVLLSGEGEMLGTLAAPTLLHGRLAAGTPPRKRRAAQQRMSYRWVQAHQEAMAQAALQPQSRWISVQDREGDLYALFAQPRPENGHWLVRVQHDRRTRESDPIEVRCLRQRAAQAPLLGTMAVALAAKPGRPARVATLQIHASRVQLDPPRRTSYECAHAVPAHPRLEVSLVWACEQDAPAGQPPIDWLLLTSLPVDTLEAVCAIVRWYACRWRIEEFFRVLKSETAVEDLQLCTRRRLEAALGLHMILSWRICSLRDRARTHPTQEAATMFTSQERHALVLLVKGAGPAPPGTLAQTVLLLARLGGHLARNGPPGHRTIARGLRTLHAALRLAEKIHPDWARQDV